MILDRLVDPDEEERGVVNDITEEIAELVRQIESGEGVFAPTPFPHHFHTL